jgi:hypothetical protein
MYTTTKDQYTVDDRGRIAAEASELGLPPGSWPDFIIVLDRPGAAEGVLLRQGRIEKNAAGDVTRVMYYAQGLDGEVVVYND